MKNILYIFIFALGAARCYASYIEVPQRSVSDYIFTAPILTNNIQGKVLDPAEPYGAIRSEDVDWIHEALAERQSLQAGNFVRRAPGTGSRVTEENSWISPIGWVDSTDAWLDPDAPILDGCRLAPYAVRPAVTNVVVRMAYTNAVSNSISVVSMPMTNGTLSVWTNKWSADILLPCVETVTNVHAWTPLDDCHGVIGAPFPMYTNTPRIAYGTLDRAFRRIPSALSITNAYAVLHGTKRLADASEYPTNRILTVQESASKYSAHVVTTNDILASIQYYLQSSCDTNGYWSGRATWTQPFDATIPTRFASELVTTGGFNRVSAAAAYAYGYAAFYRRDHGVLTLDVSTNFTVRIASPALDLTGQQAAVRAFIDARALCSSVAAMAGMAALPESGVEYVPANGEDLGWDMTIDRFVILYAITPAVKLPSW